MNLFKKVFQISNKVRVVVINSLFWLILLLLIIVLAIGNGGSTKGETLLIQPTGNIVESPKEPDLLTVLNSGDGDSIPRDTLLRDVINSIEMAKDDKKIKNIVLDLDYLYDGGFAAIEEIGNSLYNFKQSGKKVYVYSSFYSQKQYYLGSFADEIVMDPLGEISIDGIGIYRNYWKDTLDKYDVDVQVFRAGDYKSYVEPYISTSMSDLVRQQNLLWMNSIWGKYLITLEANRSFENGVLHSFTQDKLPLLKKYRGNSSKLAIEEGFVDSLKSRDEFFDTFEDQYHYLDYLSDKSRITIENNIAVVTLEGTITYSNNNSGYISAAETIDLLDLILEDQSISGLVIRINSGGGGAYASEVIRRKIEQIKKQIPVVISMGDVCASGGYWIASVGDYIFAKDSTITGSIGVFGLAIGLEETLKNNFRIYNDGVGTTPYASGFTITKNISSEIVEIYQLSVDDYYNRFLNLIKDSRDIPLDRLNKLAGGRVWSGKQAYDSNLVDNIGGFNEVEKYFENELEVENVNFVYYESDETLFNQFLGAVFNSVKLPQSFISKILSNPIAKELDLFQEIDDPKSIYALWY